jgi:CheY-like chemotaxis protein
MTALLLGGTAAAQSPGTLLVGGFGTWTHFDSKWNLDSSFGNSWGYGGRVGAFIAPNWNLEADGWYTPAQAKAGTRFLGSASNAVAGDVKASAFTARLVYSFPLGNLPSIHVGAGGVLENFRGGTDTGAGTYQFGANGLLGFNLGFSGVSLRVDGLVNYLPSAGGKFDFVFLDYNMPGLNGLETLSEIKRLHPSIQVVLMTSAEDEALIKRAQSSGAAALLRKPFYPADIDAVLQSIYGLRASAKG